MSDPVVPKKVFDGASLERIIGESFADVPDAHRNVLVAWATTDGTFRTTVARRITDADDRRGDWKLGTTFGRDVATGFYGGGFVKGSW